MQSCGYTHTHTRKNKHLFTASTCATLYTESTWRKACSDLNKKLIVQSHIHTHTDTHTHTYTKGHFSKFMYIHAFIFL